MKRAGLLTTIILLFALVGCEVGMAAELPTDLSQLEKVLALVESSYWLDVDRSQLLAGAVNGMLAALGDPYSEYFTPEEFAQFQETVHSELVGIGIIIAPCATGWKIESVLPGSPAAEAGLQADDLIVAVDDQPTFALDLDELRQLLRGSVDSWVQLSVARSDEVLTMSMQRQHIWQPTVDYRLLPGQIGFIRIESFGERTSQEFEQALSNLQRQQARALLIDLRDNPGGLLQTAAEVAEQLLPAGPWIRITYRDGVSEIVETKGPGVDLPIAVLVNELTASAAEILAGAIGERAGGLLLGTPTFGKGIMQNLYELGENGEFGAIKLTTASFATPDGWEIQGEGVQPDVLMALDVESLPLLSGEQTLYPGLEQAEVLVLQQALARLGLLEEEPSGVYTPATQAAVLAAQEQAGDIMRDGVADGWTQMEINNLVLQQAWEESNLHLLKTAQIWLRQQIHKRGWANWPTPRYMGEKARSRRCGHPRALVATSCW
ncbi:MAG: S41 family peptidase [Firmicutes bacterium]|nr:S41 family peptidase [Bacillota bacterium]